MEKKMFRIRKIIRLTLMKIGIRSDLVGFEYLCTAIELVIERPELIHSLCKELYTSIAEKFTVDKDSSVERSMRHAIDSTFSDSSFVEINKMFNTTLFAIDEKPTVGELIRLVAEYYNLEFYKEYIRKKVK